MSNVSPVSYDDRSCVCVCVGSCVRARVRVMCYRADFVSKQVAQLALINVDRSAHNDMKKQQDFHPLRCILNISIQSH